MDLSGARVLVLGFTFKENCSDVRNTRVADIVAELQSYSVTTDIHDPWADAAMVRQEYGLELTNDPAEGSYDAIIVAVAHDEFSAMGLQGVRNFGKAGAVLFDVKGIFGKAGSDLRL